MDLYPQGISFDEHNLWVELANGRHVRVGLHWLPRLENASAVVRLNYEISPFGIHWPQLNESITLPWILTHLPLGFRQPLEPLIGTLAQGYLRSGRAINWRDIAQVMNENGFTRYHGIPWHPSELKEKLYETGD